MSDHPHEIVVCGVPFDSPYEADALRQLKDMGVTSVQIYTFWRDFEPEHRGGFDWSLYDRQAGALQKAGLKYVPFILMGPKYAAPTWWLAAPEHRGLACLEHAKTSPIESIWNDAFKLEITRVLEAFGSHYLPTGVLESVQPGICGDYGEAIMPVTGNWPGDYHTHRGYWCGGADAREDFRRWLEHKFAALSSLNQAWRAHYRAFGEIEPFLPHRAPSRTAWFDFLEWYRASMTDYTEFWMAECRRIFPETPVYMCTGGYEEPEHASLFSSQARVSALHDGGIRLTNEGNKFYDNFFSTAYAWSACSFYGAYYGLEPVGPITEKGVTARIFGSAAYGNRQMFHYYGNIFGPEARPLPAAEAFRKSIHLVQEAPPPDSVAFFWPGDYTAWAGGTPENVNQALRFIRSISDCMPVNEEMILDGALQRHKLLVIALPAFSDRRVLLKIVEWVQAGGVVVSAGRLLDRELEPVEAFDALFGILPTSEETTGHVEQAIYHRDDFPNLTAIGSFHSILTWMDLAPDTELLAVVPGLETDRELAGYSGTSIQRVSAAFMRRSGKGAGIFYSGAVAMEDDPEAIFYDPGTFKALLKDTLMRYSQTELLEPQPGEIARSRIGGKLLALTEMGIQPVSAG
jgi:hypothetical protein